MSLHTVFTAAALTLAALTASAAPQEVVKLPRVVITGHSASQMVQLPRVVVTGTAVRDIAELPRVIVTGYSEATLLRLAQAAAKAAPARRS